MSHVKSRLDRLEALASMNGRRGDDVGSLSDAELAGVVAGGTPYTAAEVLSMRDDELQALAEGEGHEPQSTD